MNGRDLHVNPSETWVGPWYQAPHHYLPVCVAGFGWVWISPVEVVKKQIWYKPKDRDNFVVQYSIN